VNNLRQQYESNELAQMGSGLHSGHRYRAIREVTLVSALVNLGLSVVKIVGGTVSNSQALVADGVHSLADLVTDVAVLFAVKHSAKAPSEAYPYGRARIETAMTLALGGVLVLVGAGIAIQAAQRLTSLQGAVHPGMLALWLALLSIVANEGLYYYSIKIARRHNSKLLQANAWHHRTDSISSVVVLVGLVGVRLGFDYLDALAAIGVAAMICKVGWDLGAESLRELMDVALAEEEVQQLRDIIMQTAGVVGLHELRTRMFGSQALVDVHVIVNPSLSVSEGHHVGERIRMALLAQVEKVSDALVHIDAEDDEFSGDTLGLPGRTQVRRQMEALLAELGSKVSIREMTLHYLGDQVSVDLKIPLNALEDLSAAATLARQVADAAADLPSYRRVRVEYIP